MTIVEMFKEVGKDIGVSTRWGVKKHITQLGIHCLTETKVIAVTDQGVRVQLPSGKIETMEADTIVLAIGSRPRDTLSKELTGKIKDVYVIGDAVTPGKIFSCITDAVELGLRI